MPPIFPRASRRTAAGLAAAGLVALAAAAPRPAPAQSLLQAVGLERLSEPLTRLAVEVALSSLRSVMDVAYDGFAIGPGGEEVMISNLRLTAPTSGGAPCDIEMGRLEVFPGSLLGARETVVGAHDVDVAPGCLPPALAAQIERAGYERIFLDGLDLRLDYDPRSSALSVDLAAAAPGAMDLHAALDLGYFWPVNPGFESSAPLPSAKFEELNLRVKDRGLLSRVAELAGYEPSPESLAGAIRMALQSALTPGEDAELDPAAAALADDLAVAAADVVRQDATIELQILPREDFWLRTDLLEDPQATLALLEVRLPPRDAPPPPDAASPAEVGAALDDPASVRPDRRLALAEALAEGRGAPEMPDLAVQMLEPLADAGDLDAAVALAELLARTDPARAYRLLLAAAAQGRADAAVRMDEVELVLGLAEVFAAQDDAGADHGDPDPLLDPEATAGDVAGAASMLEDGRRIPRSYERAYLGWTLAAALGDGGAALRRDLLDRRMMARGADFWSVRRELLRTRAFEAWLARAP